MKYSFLMVILVLMLGCDRRIEILCPEETTPAAEKVAIEPDYAPRAEKCLWFDDKPAAYTIAFDDARITHYQVSGPALSERKMQGTFFINTRNIADWTGWQQLVDGGHEIGSHTRNHPKMTELSELQQREEYVRAIADIREHLKGINSIPSFAYPYGLFDDQVRRIMRDYHVSARGGGGLNRPDLSDDELTVVHGIGVYPPYDMGTIASWVDKAVSQRAWIMVYFHSVSAKGDSDDTTIPVDRYLLHLNYVQGLRDSLWIATMGEVTSYLRLRRDSEVNVKQVEHTGLELSLATPQGEYSSLSPITVKIVQPRNWRGQTIEATAENGSAQSFRIAPEEIIYVSVPRSGKILITAKKSK